MDTLIWWLGAIWFVFATALGSLIAIAATLEWAVKRAGWLPDFARYLLARRREERAKRINL